MQTFNVTLKALLLDNDFANLFLNSVNCVVRHNMIVKHICLLVKPDLSVTYLSGIVAIVYVVRYSFV